MAERQFVSGKREREISLELSLHFKIMSLDDDELSALRNVVSSLVDIHIDENEDAETIQMVDWLHVIDDVIKARKDG